MPDWPRPRRAHLLIVDAATQRVLVTEDGALPSREIQLRDEEALIVAHRMALAEFGLDDGVVLELTEPIDPPERFEIVPSLTVYDAVGPEWRPTPGHRWVAPDQARQSVPAPLRERLRVWLDELGGTPVADLRPRWARPGWFAWAEQWMRDRCAEHGRPIVGAVEQVRWTGISALLRADTDQGRVWCKAVFTGFWIEPAVTAYLSRVIPDSVAPVLAYDREQGMLLLDDVGSTSVYGEPAADAAAIELMVQLQRELTAYTDDLVALGALVRPLDGVADDLVAALHGGAHAEWIDVSPERLAAMADWVRGAARKVAALGFHDTLIHGDFHPENAAVRDGRLVIFDWSDSAIGHPLLDAITWAGWFEGDEMERGERSWHTFVHQWSDVCPAASIEAIRPVLTGLLAAYHTVSYAWIVMRLEPTCQASLAHGLRHFYAMLDRVVE